jgi:hypothetical protein
MDKVTHLKLAEECMNGGAGDAVVLNVSATMEQDML